MYGSHLGQVIHLIWTNSVPWPERLHMKFDFDLSRSLGLDVCKYKPEWQSQTMTFYLWYSYVFMYSVRRLFVPTFTSKNKNFPIQKH